MGRGWEDKPLQERGWTEIRRLQARNEHGERAQEDTSAWMVLIGANPTP